MLLDELSRRLVRASAGGPLLLRGGGAGVNQVRLGPGCADTERISFREIPRAATIAPS